MPHVAYTCLLNSYKDSLRTPPFAFKFDKVQTPAYAKNQKGGLLEQSTLCRYVAK